MSKQNLIRRVLVQLDNKYLPYENFSEFEYFKEVNVKEGVSVQRLPSKRGLYFFSKLKKDTNILEHYHNSIEYFFIKKGTILVNNKLELKEGDEFEFKPFELHHIKVIEECEMYVQLIKDDKKYK